jgi:hypothetical protein
VVVPSEKVSISLVKWARNGWQEKGHFGVRKIFIFSSIFDTEFKDRRFMAINIGGKWVLASKNGFGKK